MKKIIIIIGLGFLLTGCNIQTDSMEDITIYTSSYPIEYITDTLYGTHSSIYSIYPTGVNIHNYKLTDNQISNFSKSSLFVYAGLMMNEDSNIEAEYASSMINKNKDIKIIDASKGMEYNTKIEEIWLNPSNMLMMANNIVSGLNEYITNPYLVKDIKTNYETLQTSLSSLDSEFKDMYENSPTKTLVVANDSFKFLEKYNFNIISIEENDDLTAKTVADVKNMILNGQVKYIFVRDDEKASQTLENLIATTNAKKLTINTMSKITEIQRENKEDYISIMKHNLLQFQTELYK